MVRIECQGEQLDLLPEKAIYWPARETLLVADLHLGKAATFRAHGAPVPEHATYDTLDRLTALLAKVGAKKLVLLGDLFHAREATQGASLDAFLAWRDAHTELETLLVAGNHDRRANLDRAGIEVCDECEEGPFLFLHAPAERERFVLCGHLHPGFLLSARGRRTATLPCFWFAESYAVLPAFGMFTGLWPVEPSSGDGIYLVAGESVIPCAIE